MIHKLSSWEKVGLGFLLLLPFFVSCTEDNGFGEDAKGTVRVHGKITTRATTYEVEDNPTMELINDWWIVVVNASNEIVEIVEHDPSASTPLRDEDFEIHLPMGTYDFYTFGNITQDKVRTLAGLASDAFDVGNNMPDLSAVAYNITTDFANGTLQTSLTNPIPMSGKQTETFEKEDEQVQLELIRMLAKMKFEFRNASSKKITLHNLTIKPLNEGVIPLLPNYETLTYDNEKDPILLSDATTNKDGKTISFPSSTELAANSYASESETLYFYMRESLAESHPTGHFIMNMKIQRDGKAVEDLMYTLTGPKFVGINRNDYIVIPVTFRDYLVDFNVNFYPPIAGYPAVISEHKEEEFYVKFQTQGTFSIVPVVKEAISGTEVAPANVDFEISSVEDATPSIFAVTPYKDASGELVGQLNTNEGTACVTFLVHVYESGILYQTYERRVYIIRKN